VRISEWLAFDDSLETAQAIARASRRDNMLHTGMLKGFMDGSLARVRQHCSSRMQMIENSGCRSIT